MKRRKPQFQYRLVWKYRGQALERRLIKDRPDAILNMLRRVGTTTPWMGASPTQARRVWAWVARRLAVPFEAVATMKLRQAFLALQHSYPQLEYIRVERRQVAAWVELLDPLETLRTAGTEARDEKRIKLVNEVEAMDAEALQAFRWTPDPEQDQWRRRKG